MATAAASDRIVHLRQLLAGHLEAATPNPEEIYPTGLPALDEHGLPRGALTEIVSTPAAGPGGTLLLYGLLHASLAEGRRAVLIDGKDAFAPAGLPQAELDRLLWVRCRDAWEALKAADLIVRDGNIPLVVLLLALNPEGECRRLPATAWHRLQMLAEKAAVALVVFTARGQVGCARLRLSAGGAFPLEKLHALRGELWPALEVRLERRRRGRKGGDEELRRAVCA
jgi:hypothetical protein